MGRSRALRAVDAVEEPTGTPQPLSGSIQTAATGSRRDLLVAMRDMVARNLDEGVPARELAALTRRLLEITKEIEAIDAADEGDPVGDAASTDDEPWPAD